MSAQSLDMTADEIHSYLCRTKVPTLLVEGRGDKGILRKFGALLSEKNVDVLPVGGKEILVKVYERRGALTGAQVVFMRDRDQFCVLPEPEDFKDYVLTTGYSIENDILDKAVVHQLAGETSDALASLVTEFAGWFRVRLQNYVLDDSSLTLSDDVTAVVVGGKLSDEATREVAETEVVAPFSDLAMSESWRWVRGKSLLRVIHFHFEGSPPKYSMEQICDICIKMGPSPMLRDLVRRVLNHF